MLFNELKQALEVFIRQFHPEFITLYPLPKTHLSDLIIQRESPRVFFNFFYCCSSTVVCLFPLSLPRTSAIPTPHTWSYPSLVLSKCPLYMFLKILPLFPSIIPLDLPSGYCQCVLNFNVSGYILFACLFCWLAFIYSWDHTVFFLNCLAYFT